ncbi:MAG TPA: YbaY family lipoprotein [Opitutaceae bacterium]|nr:YbaY family lipoprotein [Opitutaceae bacterium]
MKLISPPSVFVLCALVAGLAGCATTATGPAPLPAVACELSCSDPNATLAFGSVLELRLVDFTRPDSRPSVLAERIESNPGQPPLRFHLLYNTAAIDPTHDYGVEARILHKGRPLWVQPEPVPVITKDHPVTVSIVLQPPS